ncbi:MAG TPA: PadR family transcriptional regulator [Ruminococcaceae bacterium]|nr:PadR family transcriptional regulator [Oscillospiraceae bacterium]HCA28948.1 PadR family transcriptional regulator [Oscillospiraceae bacterium]
MSEFEELISIFEVELKRGVLTLAILSQLESPQYGYSLLQTLIDKQVDIEAGTLYPLLRRLEKQNILESEWDTSESRPRKYYSLSETGKKLYHSLKASWQLQVDNMMNLIGGAEQ